ncbi:DUF2398 family protein [Kribbella sp. CA-294648]|uniref:DUF2398 family protein n=1 Tax=Kribbella sp. CA-294648 TaxID=3239948 RepID=UPI003D931189
MSRGEAQDAFVGLLAQPLVTAHTAPELFRALLRHRSQLGDWCGRLGYRLIYSGTVARLHRDACGPQLTAAPPPMAPPPRRDLVLLAVAAAACEDVDETTTVQELSDNGRALSAGADITPYNPDRRAERQAFLRALARLDELGVITRRTSDESLLRQWEDDGTGVGGGFVVNADALLQFTDPHTVGLLFTGGDESEEGRIATRGQRVLRTLVEDTALLYADLHPADAEYARAQRSWLASQAVSMTGATVEMRSEGMLLRLPTDHPGAAAVTPVFPAATAASWFALKMLEGVLGGTRDELGRVRRSSATIDDLAEHLYADHPAALTLALKESPDRLRTSSEGILAGLGLLRVEADGGWTLQPTAARFRGARAEWEAASLLDEL